MADQPGVEIYKRFYPWPDRYRLGDPVLVQQVTGMSWPEFSAAREAQEELIFEKKERGEELVDGDVDQVVLAGLIAVAFWQGNPQMTRDKARRAIERTPMEDIELIDGDDEEEADARPPDVAVDGAPPLTTSSASDDSPEAQDKTEIPRDSISDETSPNGSGSHGLLSVPPESLPA
jgi:hypothetical protein